jgi:hypothetical protein
LPRAQEITGRRSAGTAGWCLMTQVSLEALEAGLPHIRRSPADGGRVELIVRRPAAGERQVLVEATLDPVVGLVGDNWHVRPRSRTIDRSPHPDMQITVINARLAALVAGPVVPPVDALSLAMDDRRTLAGDQLYVDLDLSEGNLPPGSRLHVGSAIIEVTAQPHLGCAKFAAQYGRDAVRFVNSTTGQALRLRGLNAKIVLGGTVHTGDIVAKVAGPPDSEDALPPLARVCAPDRCKQMSRRTRGALHPGPRRQRFSGRRRYARRGARRRQ